MPNRMLKDSIQTSRSVNALSDFQFRVWVYLITYVDDYGRGSADPELLKGRVFPRRKGVTEAQIYRALEDLANSGMVNLYEVDGEPYFCFPNWSKHQRIQTKKSKFPEPPEELLYNPRYPTVSHGESPPETETETKPETETNLSIPSGIDCRADIRRVVEAWNAIGLQKVTKLLPETERYKMLKARLSQYGVEAVLKAVENVKTSDFLMGRTGKRQFQATFEWVMRPNNFIKVLEGNYANRNSGGQNQSEKTAEDYDILKALGLK